MRKTLRDFNAPALSPFCFLLSPFKRKRIAMQQIIYAQNLCAELDSLVAQLAPDRVFVLTDTTTQECCLPLLKSSAAVSAAHPIVIGSTDSNKTLESLASVWQQLGDNGASRHSLLLCLGGGMVTDLGGFAAATFKRGIPFINIPTTLLAMVDARDAHDGGVRDAPHSLRASP